MHIQSTLLSAKICNLGLNKLPLFLCTLIDIMAIPNKCNILQKKCSKMIGISWLQWKKGKLYSRNPKKFAVDTFSLVLKGMLLPLNQVPSFLFQPVYDLKAAKLPWHCPFCYMGRTSLASLDNSSQQRARRTSKISK